MKYNHGKIKREHGVMKEFESLLKVVQKIKGIKRLIPGRISRQQKSSSRFSCTFSYLTKSGLKYIMKKGGTAQELFIICSNEDKGPLIEKIGKCIKENKKMM